MRFFIQIHLIFTCVLIIALTGSYAQHTAENEFAFAQKLLTDELYALAAEQFSEFARKYPSNELSDDALFKAGLAFFAAQDYNQAFERYRDLEIRFATSPFLPEARRQLALCKLKQEKFAEAAQLFRRIHLLHPEPQWAAPALLAAGRASIKNDDQEAALGTFMVLLDLYPASPEGIDAHLEILQIYLKREAYGEAMRRIDRLLSISNPDQVDPRILYAKAYVFDQTGQGDTAVAIYQQLVENFPKSAQAASAHFHLGETLQARMAPDRALKHFDQCLSISQDPELNVKAQLAMGDLLAEQGDLPNALILLQKASGDAAGRLKLDALLRTGQVLTRLERYTESESAFRKIISQELDQTDSLATEQIVKAAYFRLKDVLAKIGNPQEALRVVNGYLERFPAGRQSADMLYHKGQLIQDHIGDYARAQRSYDQFMERYPIDERVDEAQLAIARCYEQMQQFGLAKAAYERYLEQFPAGDQYDWAAQRRHQIAETVESESTHALARLTQLLAEYADHQKRNTLPLEIGRLYLETQDFRRATQQFKKVLATSKNEELIEGVKNEAYFLLGKTYLKRRDYSLLVANHKLSQAFEDSARVVFKFLGERAESRWAEDAYFNLAKISLESSSVLRDSLPALLQLKDQWEKRFPKGSGLDHLLIRIANLKMQGDDTKINEALVLYDQILTDYADGSFVEEAKFRKCQAFSRLQKDSTTAACLRVFIKDHLASPWRPQALLLRADLEARAEDSTAAEQSLRQIIEQYFYSDFAKQAKEKLADFYFAQKDFSAALELYDRDTQTVPRHAGTNGTVPASADWLQQAKALEQLGRSTEALGKYFAFLRNNPTGAGAVEAKIAIARIAEIANNYTLAETYYQKLLDKGVDNPHKFEAKAAIADIYFNQKRYKEAKLQYLSALSMAPDPERERYATGQAIRCKYKLGEFAAADADVKQFKKKFRDHEESEAQFLDDKGHAYIAKKNFELAEKAFKKLRDDFRTTEFGPRGDFGLGEVYLITNRTDEALKILTELPAKYPNSEVTPLTYYNLGDFYYKSQQIENAVAAFQQVLAHPKGEQYQRGALRYLITAAKDLQQWDRAVRLTREYLEKYPDADDTFRRKIEMARFLKELNELQRAIDHFSRLKPYADNEGLAEIQFYIAECYQEMGNFERAAGEFLKVKYTTQPTKFPWHVTAMFTASDCFVRLGQIEQARGILEQIVKERGSDQFGKFAKSKLEELANEQPVVTPKGGS